MADLTAGDRLMLRGPGFGRRALATDLALGVGVAVGDGYLTQSIVRGRAQESLILTMHAAEAPVLAAVAEAVHAEPRRAPGGGRGSAVRPASGVITRSAATARLMLSAASAVAVFREFAILDEGAAAIRFTPAVFDLDRPALAAVLRGLFTADATVANYGEQSRYVSLDSTSLELLRQIQLLLLAFGIKAQALRGHRGCADGARRGGGRAIPSPCLAADQPRVLPRSSSRRSASTRRARRRRPWRGSTATSR